MAVLRALRRTPRALLRNPIVLVPVLALLVFQLPQLALQSTDPLLSSLVSVVFSLVFVALTPFFQGGVISMADEALDGRTSLATFVDAGRSNYLTLLVAYLVVLGVNTVLGIATVAVAILAGANVVGSGGLAGANLVVLVAVVILVAVVVLAFLAVVFFLQFYGQAIVLDDLGAVDGLRRSVSVVRNNLASTLGYSVLTGVLGGLVGGLFGAGSVVFAPRSSELLALPEPTPAVLGVVLLVIAVGGTLFGAFVAVYSVSFYRAITA